MFYKVMTHDYRPPIQGGDPIWSGADLPYTLPVVELNTGQHECAAGWNFTDNLATALRIAGLWPNGRPSAVFEVTPSSDAIQRDDKWRSSQLVLLRQLEEAEIRDGVLEMSQVFGKHAAQMADSQMAWRAALARPERDEMAVQESLAVALAARGLDWKLKRLAGVWDAWDAWDAWTGWTAWAAWDVWDARGARGARAARAAWDVWSTRDAWDVKNAWDPQDIWDDRDAWDPKDVWDNREAREARDVRAVCAVGAALRVEFASLAGWINYPANLLSTGLRDAYQSGLAVAFPAGPGLLGWVMED